MRNRTRVIAAAAAVTAALAAGSTAAAVASTAGARPSVHAKTVSASQKPGAQSETAGPRRDRGRRGRAAARQHGPASARRSARCSRQDGPTPRRRPSRRPRTRSVSARGSCAACAHRRQAEPGRRLPRHARPGGSKAAPSRDSRATTRSSPPWPGSCTSARPASARRCGRSSRRDRPTRRRRPSRRPPVRSGSAPSSCPPRSTHAKQSLAGGS